MAMLTGAVCAGGVDVGTGVGGGPPPGDVDEPPPQPARTANAKNALGTKRRLNCIRETPK